jgi:hypothetical protein
VRAPPQQGEVRAREGGGSRVDTLDRLECQLLGQQLCARGSRRRRGRDARGDAAAATALAQLSLV